MHAKCTTDTTSICAHNVYYIPSALRSFVVCDWLNPLLDLLACEMRGAGFTQRGRHFQVGAARRRRRRTLAGRRIDLVPVYLRDLLFSRFLVTDVYVCQLSLARRQSNDATASNVAGMWQSPSNNSYTQHYTRGSES